MKYTEGSGNIQEKRIRMPICDKTVITEISNDYTLPDYHPEIRRVLYVSSNILPPAKYVSASGAEYSGMIDYSIIYVSVDGKLYSAPLSAEYTLNFPINIDGDFDFNEGISSCVDVISETVSTRLSGPRKINVKSKLKAHARAYATMSLDEKISGDVEPDTLELLSKEEDICIFTRTVSDAFEISEEIIPDTPEFRVISADGKVFIKDISLSDGEAAVNGEIYLTLLLEYSDSDEVAQIQRKIQFSHTIDNEELCKSSRCTAAGHLSDISVNIEEQGIICDMGLIIELEAQTKKSFSYIADIYSTNKSSKAQYKSYDIPANGYCTNGNISMNEKISKENIGIPQNAIIVDVHGTAIAEKIFAEDGKNFVVGQAKYLLLVLSEGEYSSVEIALPFKYAFLAENGSYEQTSCEAKADVISCKVRQDNEEISIDAELSIACWGIGNKTITVLDEIRFEDEIKREKGNVIIYYPSPEDTLWTIAKRYFVPVSKIQLLNGLSDDIINKEYILI